MKAKIEEDAVKVTWKHVTSDKSFRGYYVLLEDIESHHKDGPAYVHVGRDKQSAKIIGMRPRTKYNLMVKQLII